MNYYKLFKRSCEGRPCKTNIHTYIYIVYASFSFIRLRNRKSVNIAEKECKSTRTGIKKRSCVLTSSNVTDLLMVASPK